MSFLETKTSDFGLQQGKEFSAVQHNVIDLQSAFNLHLLEETTGPNLGSVTEGLENMSVNKENEEAVQEMKDLEHQFNAKLGEYTTLYRKYLSQLTQEDEMINKYKNTNVANNGTINYVNGFGYTRQFSQSALEKRDDSCPTKAPLGNSQDIYSQLSHGQPMGIGEPCGLEGTNVRNETNGKIYWMAQDGKLHYYPDEETWQATQKNGGCPSGYTNLTNDVLSTMSVGSPMNSMSTCDTLQVNAGLWKRITDLNSELIEISDRMYNNIQKLSKKDETVSKHLQDTRDELAKRIQLLNEERKKYVGTNQNVSTLNADYQDIRIGVTREYTHYLAWTIGAIALSALAVKYVMK